VRDINPGANDSDPRFLTNVNGTVFFSADNGTSGRELWKSDGTFGGTALVRDIRAGSNGSDPQNLTDVNGTLFFAADDGTFGRELWRSNGSTVGTTLVRDIHPSGSSNPRYLTNANGIVFFRATNPNFGDELWRSDGTSIGTTLVADINPGTASSNPRFLTNVNGNVFFNADDGTYGLELWRTGVVTTVSVEGGNNQSVGVNQQFADPLRVRVLDQFGEPLLGVPVLYTVIPTSNFAGATFVGGTAASVRVATDLRGYAEAIAVANPMAGTYTVVASVGNVSNNFTLTNLPAPSLRLEFSIHPPRRVGIGQRFRVQVRVIDPDGDMTRLSEVPVRISLRAGRGLSGTLVRWTNTSGVATFNGLSISQRGQYRLVARLGNGMQVISNPIIVW
jgi:ELWxxDGT repeat protein